MTSLSDAPGRTPGPDELAAVVRAEIADFDYPAGAWTVPQTDAAGERVLDVLIIGGGQAGTTAAFRLLREGVQDILVVDESPAGAEGPWVTWARMATLRTVKQLHGTESGIRSASFRTWFDAAHGAGAFAALELIPKEEWMAYLVWLRRTVGIPVRNDTVVTGIVPEGDGWAVAVRTAGRASTLHARKVVAATGMGGAGGPVVPDHLAALGPGGWAHSSADIDWPALAGKRVAVLGIGASAFDNAATALEHGAAEVVQFGRRAELPTVNTLRYLEKKGLFRAYDALEDDVRLGIARANFSRAVPPTAHSIARCEAHAGYALRLGVAIDGAQRAGDGIRLHGAGDEPFDFVVAATGFTVDLTRVPWLAGVAEHIRTWGDARDLGDDRLDRFIARHPYLGRGMSAQPRSAAAPAALANLHLFNLAAQVSFGVTCIGLNGLPWSVDSVVGAIVADLVHADGAALLDGFLAYDAADTSTPGALVEAGR